MPLRWPFCGVLHAKPSDIPEGRGPTLRSLARSHHPRKVVSAAAAGAPARLAAAAGEAEEPRGGAAASLSPVAEAGTAPPAGCRLPFSSLH